MKILSTLWLLTLGLALAEPVAVIFDTDMGNDVDDLMALSMLHTLQCHGQCKLLAVTLTKDQELAAPFVDAVDTFYGFPDTPVGVVHDGATRDEGKFLKLAHATNPDGSLTYPHDLRSGRDAPEAVSLLRKTLAQSADHSVVMIQVGFFTNLSRLLDSPPDAISELTGEQLVKKKVRLVSLMAGAFKTIDNNARYTEYNVTNDIPAARKLAERWPTPRVWSGFEIGIAAPFPHQSIEHDLDYVPHHPLKEAYVLYQPPPHDRPTWDPTAVLQALLPDKNYFELSPAGTVTVEMDGATTFQQNPEGRDRFLILPPEKRGSVQEIIAKLSTEAPAKKD